MTDINKFLSDINKAKKHNRQNNGEKADYNKMAKDMRSLFERSTACPKELAGSVFEYWENTYINNLPDLTYEPSEENSNHLAAFLAFLENSIELQDLITEEDWKELGDLVNYEADDLPINLLQDLMSILVSKGAY